VIAHLGARWESARGGCARWEGKKCRGTGGAIAGPKAEQRLALCAHKSGQRTDGQGMLILVPQLSDELLHAVCVLCFGELRYVLLRLHRVLKSAKLIINRFGSKNGRLYTTLDASPLGELLAFRATG